MFKHPLIFALMVTVLILSFSSCQPQNTTSDDVSTIIEYEYVENKNTQTQSSENNEKVSSQTGSKNESATQMNQNSKNEDISSKKPIREPSSKASQTASAKTEVNMIQCGISALSPTSNETVILANDNVYSWNNNYTIKSSASYYGQGDLFFGNPVTFKWSCDKKADSFILKISTNKSFSQAEEMKTTSNQIKTDKLFAGKTYYWQVTANFKEGIAVSNIFSFRTAQSPRTIRLSGVTNTGDIGGYLTESGKRVKQGMAYRGANLDSIEGAGLLAAAETYGIKTDLDLRRAGEGLAGVRSPLGDRVIYFHISGPYYVGSAGINTPSNYQNLANEIEVFSIAEAYPIYFHCSIGRDRTGTLAMLINGLLGVKKEDLFLDYELSFFSEGGCRDGASVSNMVDKFQATYQYLASYGGEDGKPFSSHVERFMQDIGVSKQKIKAIKKNLLEDS